MRAVNRIAAALLGLLLIVVGLVAAAELALAWTGHAPWPAFLDRWLAQWRTTTIGDPVVFWSAVGAAAVGLLLLLSQLRRWRPDRLPTGDAEEGVWWLSRRGVERRTGDSAAAMIGVHNPHVDIKGGVRHWRVKLTAEANPDQIDDIERTLRDELDRLDLPDTVPVEVALRTPRRVA